MTQDQIEVVCAWCVPHKHISGPVGAEHTSHGICPECLEKQFPESLRERQIRAISGIIWAAWRLDWTTKEAIKQNSLGWTVDVYDRTEDHWLRCEGVVLTPDELDRAIKASWEMV